MVRPRNTTSNEERDREMAQAGARFETYVRAAMVEVELPTMAELYRASGVAASTWSGWFRGVSAPRRNSLKLAGPALNRTPEQLLAAWEGEKAQKPRRTTETTDSLVSALLRQSEAIEGLTTELAKGRADQREATDALLRLVVTAIPAPPARPVDSERELPVDTRP